MSAINIVKTIKEIHSNFVVLVKIGNFYHVYGKDSYIVSYLFNYQIKKIENNYSTCGFPLSSYNKVTAKLEEKRINYLSVDRRNNYEKDDECDNKNLNTYEETFEKAHKYVTRKNKIENICGYLYENINKDEIQAKIGEIEKIIYEGRKI